MPRGNVVEIVRYEQSGKEYNAVPFIMAEGLQPIRVENSWRLDKEPMGRVDKFHICFFVCIPDLRRKAFFGIDDSLYLSFERSYGHGVCHDEC